MFAAVFSSALVVASGAAAGLLDPAADAVSDVTTPLLEGNPAASADTVVETATGTATEVVAPVVEEVLETAQPVVDTVAGQAPVDEIVQVVTGAVAQAPGESGSGAGSEGPVSAGAASAGGSTAPVPAPSSDTPAGEAPGLGNPLGNAVVRQDGHALRDSGRPARSCSCPRRPATGRRSNGDPRWRSRA